jgi:hypothetical protein
MPPPTSHQERRYRYGRSTFQAILSWWTLPTLLRARSLSHGRMTTALGIFVSLYVTRGALGELSDASRVAEACTDGLRDWGLTGVKQPWSADRGTTKPGWRTIPSRSPRTVGDDPHVPGSAPGLGVHPRRARGRPIPPHNPREACRRVGGRNHGAPIPRASVPPSAMGSTLCRRTGSRRGVIPDRPTAGLAGGGRTHGRAGPWDRATHGGARGGTVGYRVSDPALDTRSVRAV